MVNANVFTATPPGSDIGMPPVTIAVCQLWLTASARAFVLIAQPHSASTSLMVALARLLPQQNVYAQYRHGFTRPNATDADFARWGQGWGHSDDGLLSAGKLALFLGEPVDNPHPLFNQIIIKQHLLPFADNVAAVASVVDEFSTRGVILLRSVDASFVAKCCRYAMASYTRPALLRRFEQLQEFNSRWRRFKSHHAGVLLVEFEALISNTAQEIHRIANHWKLPAYLARAQAASAAGALSTRSELPRLLANRTSVDEEIDALFARGLPSARQYTYSPELKERCWNISRDLRAEVSGRTPG